MLSKITNFSGSALSKFLLGALVLVFIFSGAMAGRTPKDTVVSIDGERAISTTEFVRAKKKIADSLSNAYPGADLSAINLNQITLNELVKDKLINLELENLGLHISDDLVVQEISQNPAFQNKDKKFDKDLFQRILVSNGITEKDFVKHTKNNIALGFLNKSMVGFKLPNKIIDQFNMYNNQVRNVDLYIVDRKPASKIDVSQEEISLYYESNKSRYTNPELREIEYITIKPEFFRRKANISDAQINKEVSAMKFKAEADKKAARIRLVQNKLEQAMFESIKDIEDSIAEGSPLKKVAESYGLKYVKIPSVSGGEISSKAPKSKRFTEEAFSLEEGMASDLIQSDNGGEYYILNTVSLKPSKPRPLSDVRGAIISEIRQDKAMTEQKKYAYDVKNAILKNDKRPEGVVIKDVSISRPDQGKGQFGVSPEHLVEIFNMEKGDLSSVFPTKDKKFVFAKLKKIQNPKTSKIPLESKIQISRFFDDTVMQSFLSSLHKKYKIKLFEGNIPQEA